jgi:hypothetical protein
VVAAFATANCRFGYGELEPANSGGSSSSGGSGSTTGGASNGGSSNGGSGIGGAVPLGGSEAFGGADPGAAGQGGVNDAGASGAAGAGGAGTVLGCTVTADCDCAALQGQIYWFCKNPIKWSDAETQCQTQAMHLTRIDSQLENDFLVDTGTTAGVFDVNGFVQIGANDQTVAGDWSWVDGTLFWQGGPGGTAIGGLYFNWLATSPSGSGIQHCSGIVSTGKWQDRSCTALSPFVCEGQAP